MSSSNLLGALALLVGTSGCATDRPNPTPAASPPTAAAAPAAARGGTGADRDVTREGVDPPRYKPSSSSKAPIPITQNRYGAYKPAPDAPQLGDIAVDFELPLADGGQFKLADARGAGHVLIMFYRGFW